MVFIQLPSQHSDEEKMLLQKYAKLKRKKKVFMQHKTPKPEKPDITARIQLKRVAESSKQDAKEIAKRLIKTGAIVVAKPPDKEKEGKSFKRSKSLARKRVGADKPAGFKPFQPDSEKEPALPSTGFSMVPSGTTGQTNSWNEIAASYNRRGDPPKEKQQNNRELVSYEDL